MKLKYYLRGLGIGMLVAALVLILSGNTGTKMSDEAVKRRASQLGMVERDKTVLGDMEKETSEEESGEAASEPIEEEPSAAASEENIAGTTGETRQDAAGESGEASSGEGTSEEEKEADPVQGGQPQEDGNTMPPEAEETEQDAVREIEEKADEVAERAGEVADNAVTGRTILLEVSRGDSSVSVARKAAEAGLVQSAADFDVFLCQNGYDKRISIGSYEITEGASEKEIAEIITKSR